MPKTILDDWNEATNRVIIRQTLLATKKSIAVRFPQSEEFLATEFGSALVSTGVGFAFTYLPRWKSQRYADILSRELANGSASLFNIVRRKIVRFF